MKRSLIYILVLFLFSVSLYSQAVEKVTIMPDGKIYKSAPTKNAVKYRITVQGTYSMWTQFTDCHGVDAAYVYDVPKDEIAGLRWPPEAFLKIPHWVGDDSLWLVSPYFDLSLRKYTGFRIDNEPLPNSGINLTTHRYQIEKVGTGNPFDFQILDSAYSTIKEGLAPMYGDNCGQLIVSIEEIIPIPPHPDSADINICDITTVCDSLGHIYGLRLEASIFETDSANIHGKSNKLREIGLEKLGIVYNGKFFCPTKMDCVGDTTRSVAIGILLDRSMSMDWAISKTDTTQRLRASKKAINGFIDNFHSEDSAFVMSFAGDIRLDQDWTNNKETLKSSVNKIEWDYSTNMFDAIDSALVKISTSGSPTRALVLLSDGGSNVGSGWDESMKLKIAQKNIPIYIVALGFKDTLNDLDGRAKIDSVVNASNGKAFDVYNSSKLDSVYQQMAVQIREDACCTIYIDSIDCNPDGDNFVKILYSPNGTTTISKTVKFGCLCGEIKDKPDTCTERSSYTSVTIGTQEWMGENLDVCYYRNGDPIPQVTDSTEWQNLKTGAWCYWNNDPANGAIYGKLYNWYAVNDSRGLAPNGFHVASDAEWTTLSAYLGGESAGGGKLKSTGTREAGDGLWQPTNTGATNESGFSALPGSYREYYGSFGNIGYSGDWWSSTEHGTSHAWYRFLYYNSSDLYRNFDDKRNGFAVRCVKDSKNTPPTINYLTPNSTSIGAEVILTGTNFGTTRGTSVVSFTGADVSEYQSWSDTEIKVKVPVGAQTGKLSVTVNNQKSNEVDFTVRTTTCNEKSSYTSVTIGTQVWMGENLDVCYYRNGDEIPQVTDSSEWVNLKTDAWCYFNNDPTMGAIYGKLYNWYAVNDSRGLAPEGWHVPSDEEWTSLLTYLGGENVAGGKLKEAGTSHWQSPNEGATNETGFSALPGGYRNRYGMFDGIGRLGYWWSSTECGTPGAWSRNLSYRYSNLYRGNDAYYKDYGFSVRCVKD